ncbi:MAG: hypothetical protein RR552_07305 [Oscillospiraceae bacterium]
MTIFKKRFLAVSTALYAFSVMLTFFIVISQSFSEGTQFFAGILFLPIGTLAIIILPIVLPIIYKKAISLKTYISLGISPFIFAIGIYFSDYTVTISLTKIFITYYLPLLIVFLVTTISFSFLVIETKKIYKK